MGGGRAFWFGDGALAGREQPHELGAAQDLQEHERVRARAEPGFRFVTVQYGREASLVYPVALEFRSTGGGGFRFATI